MRGKDGVDPSARKRVLGNRTFALPIGDAEDGLGGVDESPRPTQWRVLSEGRSLMPNIA
jgi:hypothetical protein